MKLLKEYIFNTNINAVLKTLREFEAMFIGFFVNLVTEVCLSRALCRYCDDSLAVSSKMQ